MEISLGETTRAKEALAKAAERAMRLVSRGRFGDARNAFDKAREQFGGNEWFKDEGEEKIASALKGIEKSRLDAATRAVAQAGRLLDAKRFDEAHRALAGRAGWPEGARQRAEELVAKIASARTAAEEEEKRISAWLDCLIGLEKAGKTSLAAARAHLERERKRLRELGLGREKDGKLARIERRLRPAKLVEDIAEIALQRTKGTVRFRWKGETVAAKVVSVEGGVLKARTTGGKEETIPISEMAAEDVVAHARIMRGGTKDPVTAASYYFLRGELDAARNVIGGHASDTALALVEDIALVASASRERKARQEAEAARAAAETESHIGPARTLTLDLGGGVKMKFVYIRPGCEREGIAVIPSDYRGGFDSRIEYHPKQRKFLLFLDNASRGDTKGRRRFSIRHELGHFYLPEHREILLQGRAHCSQTERFASSARTEAEADEFAARLLMPTQVFRKEMKDVAVKELRRLARVFESSLAATARRMIEETSMACSVVFSDGRTVRYAKHSESMRLLGLWGINAHDPVPPQSRTAIYAREGKIDKAAAVIPADYWYKAARRRPDERMVWEGVERRGRYGYVTFLVYEEG